MTRVSLVTQLSEIGMQAFILLNRSTKLEEVGSKISLSMNSVSNIVFGLQNYANFS